MARQRLLLGSLSQPLVRKLSFAFPQQPHKLKTLCIPTAANVEKDRAWLVEEKQALTDHGFKLVDFNIAGKTPNEVAARLADADIVYVTGGNSYYLLEQMKKCDFASSIKKFLNKGGLYIGVSAGAVVTGAGIGFIGDLDDSGAAQLEDYEGLHLIDCKILPHIDHPKYGPKIQQMTANLLSPEPVIGLRDDQALYVRGDYMEIY